MSTQHVCGFFEPTKTQSPFAMCQNAQNNKKVMEKAHARQPSLLSLCAFQALLKKHFQVMLALLEHSIFEALLHPLHVAHHGGHLNKLNNNNMIPSKTHNGNTNLRQTHHPRKTHMASLTTEKKLIFFVFFSCFSSLITCSNCGFVMVWRGFSLSSFFTVGLTSAPALLCCSTCDLANTAYVPAYL